MINVVPRALRCGFYLLVCLVALVLGLLVRMVALVMIEVIYGVPGSGKTLLAVRDALRAIQKGRRVYANFALAGASRLIDIRDCVAPEFGGALLIVDEVGTQINARSTLETDEMYLSTLSQHRKNKGVDIKLITQHPRFLDIQLRSISEKFTAVSRIGMSGEAWMGVSLPLWARPLAVFLRPIAISYATYTLDQFDDSAVSLRPGAEPVNSGIFLFRRSLAEAYSTYERVVPVHLKERWQAQLADASARAALPAQVVVRSIPQLVPLPPGYTLSAPPVLPKEKRKDQLMIPVDDILSDAGYFSADAASPPALAEPAGAGQLRYLSPPAVDQGA